MMKTTYWYVLILIVIVGLLFFFKQDNSPATNEPVLSAYDTFGTCLANAGAKFYGAFWCPHCQDQKKLFRDSKTIPYVECSTEDGEGQTQICIDEGITGYPTWKFADGAIMNGAQQLSVLANKTNCPLP